MWNIFHSWRVYVDLPGEPRFLAPRRASRVSLFVFPRAPPPTEPEPGFLVFSPNRVPRPEVGNFDFPRCLSLVVSLVFEITPFFFIDYFPVSCFDRRAFSPGDDRITLKRVVPQLSPYFVTASPFLDFFLPRCLLKNIRSIRNRGEKGCFYST